MTVIQTHPITSSPFSIEDKRTLELENEFILSYKTYYKEFSYDNKNNISRIDIYENNTKTNQLFSKVFTYNNKGDITSVILTNFKSSKVLTKTLQYDNNGNITSLEITIT